MVKLHRTLLIGIPISVLMFLLVLQPAKGYITFTGQYFNLTGDLQKNVDINVSVCLYENTSTGGTCIKQNYTEMNTSETGWWLVSLTDIGNINWKWESSYYAGITINGTTYPERINLTKVPFAMMSNNSLYLNGQPASYYLDDTDTDTYNTTGEMSAAVNSTGTLWANLSLYSYWANILNKPAHIFDNYTNQSFYLGDYQASDFQTGSEQSNTTAEILAATNNSAQWNATVFTSVDVLSENITIPVGDHNNPTLRFVGDTGTGIYSPLATRMTFTSDTSDIMTIDDNNPTVKIHSTLEVEGTSTMFSAIINHYLNVSDWSNASYALNLTGIKWANYSLFSNRSEYLGNYQYTDFQIGSEQSNDTTDILDVVEANDYWNNSYLIGYTNMTLCGEDKILKVVGGVWTCQADADSGAGGASKWIDGGTYLYPNTTYADNIAVNGYLNATDWSNASSALNSTGISWANYSLYSSWANLIGNPNYTNQSFYLGNYDASRFVLRDTWTTHDSYPAACSAGSAVTGLGDTLTCSAFQTGSEQSNTTEEVQDAAGSLFGGTETLITVTYDDAGNDIDFVVNNNLHSYSWTNVVDADITDTLTCSNVEGTDTGTLTNGYYCTYDSVGTEIDCSTQYPVASSDSTWTLHNSYPAACSAGSAITALGDTSTCSAFQTGSEQSNTTEEVQDAGGSGYTNYSVGVDVHYDDTNNQFSATFDCSEVTGVGIGCNGEKIDVTDNFLNASGDSSTGNITFTDGKGIKGTSGGSVYYNGTCWIMQGSTATIELC